MGRGGAVGRGGCRGEGGGAVGRGGGAVGRVEGGAVGRGEGGVRFQEHGMRPWSVVWRSGIDHGPSATRHTEGGGRGIAVG